MPYLKAYYYEFERVRERKSLFLSLLPAVYPFSVAIPSQKEDWLLNYRRKYVVPYLGWSKLNYPGSVAVVGSFEDCMNIEDIFNKNGMNMQRAIKFFAFFLQTPSSHAPPKHEFAKRNVLYL